MTRTKRRFLHVVLLAGPSCLLEATFTSFKDMEKGCGTLPTKNEEDYCEQCVECYEWGCFVEKGTKHRNDCDSRGCNAMFGCEHNVPDKYMDGSPDYGDLDDACDNHDDKDIEDFCEECIDCLEDECFIDPFKTKYDSKCDECATASACDAYTVAPMTSFLNPASLCGHTDTHTSYVLVEHTLKNGKDLNDDSLFLLGRFFLDTYNSLNSPNVKSSVCDGQHMRVAESVIAHETNDLFEKIEGEKYDRKNILYEVTMKCKDCKSRHPLFDTGTTRKLDDLLELLNDETPSMCSCQPNVESRAATEKEFLLSFREKIETLDAESNEEEDLKDKIHSATSVIEYDEVKCHWQEDEFESDWCLNMTVEPEESDYDALGAAFKNVYNELTAYYCDPNFRVVSEVEVEDAYDYEDYDDNTDPVDNLRGRHLTTKKKKKKKKGAKRFKVKGKCDGCSSSSSLFNDGKRRHLDSDSDDLQVTDVSIQAQMEARDDWGVIFYDLRHVNDGKDKCFCATRSVGRRAPTAHEFFMSYNKTLAQASKHNLLSQNYGVVQATEDSSGSSD